MYSLILLILFGFTFSLVATPLVRNFARRRGLVDRPDNSRKLHVNPVPQLGGIAIVVSFLLAYGALFLTGLQASHIVAGALPFVVRVAPALLIIFLIGIADDLRPVRPWKKFLGQTIAATVAWLVGIHVAGFGGYELPAWLSLPATVFWLVLCTNAINLIDGVDGLAAGVGIFATATTLLAALLQHNVDLALAVAPLLGCLLGFLRYNFNPATIFLGDSGSLVIGFFLGCCSIIWSQKSATILGMTAPLLALAIPLLDTGLAVVRRFLRNQPIFGADRGHIHHRLLDRGFTPRRVALVVYGLCALAATFALCVTSTSLQGPVIILFCAATWIGVQHLGYVEFGVAGRMVVGGAFRRLLNSTIALKSFEDRLLATDNSDDFWSVICEGAKEFGFETVAMGLPSGSWSHRVRDGEDSGERTWLIRIPLPDEGFVELTRRFEADAQHSIVAPWVDVIRRATEGRSAEPVTEPMPATRAAAATSVA